MTVLDRTLSTTFEPGSNLLGPATGAGWTFVLPRREFDVVAVLGEPSPATLSVLAGLGRRVRIVGRGRRSARRVDRLIARSGCANVERVEMVRLHGHAVDLLLLAARPEGSHLPDAELDEAIRRSLASDGILYAEPGSPVEAVERVAGRCQPLWVAPRRGEVRLAAPLDDERAVGFLRHRGVDAPLTRAQRAAWRVRRIVRREDGTTRVRAGRAVLLAAGNDEPAGPPEYLRALAAHAGVFLDEHSWALAVPGGYASRKVVIFLFPPDSRRPEYVVKMTGRSLLNPRLENEWRALTELREKGFGSPETVPQPAFFGYHSGLAVLGQTALAGVPFRARTDRTPPFPHTRAAIQFLVELAATTAAVDAVSPADVATGIEHLLRRFVELYAPSPHEKRFLSAQVERIAAATSFPLVFQHGDPGAWNLLITSSDEVAFLDWEAAEPRGVPLWDMFYFMRSFAVSVSRASGVRDATRGFARLYLADSELSSLLATSTARYCERIRLDPQLVEPLFHLCWMHRALKEATRLRPNRLDRSHYLRLLRTCMQRRNALPFPRLFAT